MNNFIGVYRNSLSSEDCQKIIEWFEKSPNLQSAGMVKGKVLKTDSTIKDSLDICVNTEDKSWITKTIVSALVNGLKTYKKTHSELDDCLNEWWLSETYNLQKYVPGGGYKLLHCESATRGDSIRVMAWMIYLNTIEDKGGTYFSSYDLTEKAEEGKLLIWPAYWTHCHRSVPSPTETKYIATGWFEFV